MFQILHIVILSNYRIFSKKECYVVTVLVEQIGEKIVHLMNTSMKFCTEV